MLEPLVVFSRSKFPGPTTKIALLEYLGLCADGSKRVPDTPGTLCLPSSVLRHLVDHSNPSRSI